MTVLLRPMTAADAVAFQMGFATFGVEPDSLCVDGVLHDEELMVRVL